jgi:hypothetical protein
MAVYYFLFAGSDIESITVNPSGINTVPIQPKLADFTLFHEPIMPLPTEQTLNAKP